MLFSHCEKKENQNFKMKKSLRAESGRKDGRELAELETLGRPRISFLTIFNHRLWSWCVAREELMNKTGYGGVASGRIEHGRNILM
jgi:hypothetical protein